jgi:hypothetical protein
MMGRRCALVAAALLGVWLAAAAPCAALEASPGAVTVEQILSAPSAYSGAIVTVRGELVGDFGRRDDGTIWAQLNGDPYAEAPLRAGGSLAGPNLGIGVRVPAGAWPGLDRPGGYRVRGPLVEVTGTWRYHDPGRGGESYLDVTLVVVIAPSLSVEGEGFRWLPLGLGAGLLAAAGALTLASRRRR